MQMQIAIDVETTAGEPIITTIWNTIHNLGATDPAAGSLAACFWGPLLLATVLHDSRVALSTTRGEAPRQDFVA